MLVSTVGGDLGRLVECGCGGKYPSSVYIFWNVNGWKKESLADVNFVVGYVLVDTPVRRYVDGHGYCSRGLIEFNARHS